MKNKWIYSILMVFCALQINAQLPSVKRMHIDSVPSFSKIAFGSFNSEKSAQEVWTSIVEIKPHLFISMGDIISGNNKSIEEVYAKYAKQLDKKFYRWFLERIPQLSVWNVNESQLSNNSNGSLEELRKANMKFYGLDSNSLPASNGLYYTKEIKQKGKSIQFYMLDVHSFRTKDNVLGEKQMQWLRKEVETSNASAHILVSGFPYFLTSKKSLSWAGNYAASFQELKNFIKLYSDKSFILMSGGARGAVLSKNIIPEVNYPIYEINSSALNVAGKSRKKVKGKNLEESFYVGRNFGLMTIKWSDPMQFTFEIFDIQSFNVREIKIYLEDLR